jgi:uncharacterized protein YegP (UPF0339 family)
MATVTYPCYWLRKDSRGEWRWTYYAKNGEEIGVSSEGYKNYSDCRHGVTLMQGSSSDPIFYTE